MLYLRCFWIFLWCLCGGTLATTDYFCRNLIPQPSILIDQLMGIWYGVEIINHDSERHFVRREPSCPIIHISEDRSYSSLFKDYNNYIYNYGNRGYDQYDLTTQRGRTYPHTPPPYTRDPYSQDPYDRNRPYDTRDPYRRTPSYNRDSYNRDQHNRDPNRDIIYNREQYNREQYNREQYDRDRLMNKGYQDPYAREAPNYDLNRQYQRDRQYHADRYPPVGFGKKFYDEIKRLRLLWDENGVSTEYRIRLNVSMPGFWISSGPENGSSLDPQVGHFAGTVQVLKVVGHHLVLNFCHQQPDKRYFTVILSRSLTLNNYDISGVHGLLHTKGLDTNNIKKVCNSAIENVLNQILFFLTVGIVFCR